MFTVNQFCWGLFKAAQMAELSDVKQASHDRVTD